MSQNSRDDAGVTYEVKPDHIAVRVVEHATVDSCTTAVEEMAAITKTKPRIWYLPESLAWQQADLIKLGEHGKSMGLKCKTAFIAQSDLVYAMARQHIVYRVDRAELLGLFRSEDEAFSWIR